MQARDAGAVRLFMRPELLARLLAAEPACPSSSWLVMLMSVVLPMPVCRIGTFA